MWKYYEALGTAENHPRRSSLIISWLDQGRWLKLFRKGYGGIWRDMQDKCLKTWMWVGQKWEEMISSCFPTMKKRQYFAPVQKQERLNRANILLRGLKAGTAEQEIVFSSTANYVRFAVENFVNLFCLIVKSNPLKKTYTPCNCSC